jgi:hypothetical protein
LRTVEEVEKYFPEFKAIIDITEQEIQRPKDKKRKKDYYSGKKKKHTIKMQYMINKEGKYCINQDITRKEDNMTIQFTRMNNLKHHQK